MRLGLIFTHDLNSKGCDLWYIKVTQGLQIRSITIQYLLILIIHPFICLNTRDKAMLLNQRRSSVDSYLNEEDSDKALKEEEENLRLFKERVQAG